ncbi:putative sugar O-methyltransferase [Spongiactinospora sp. 9N601]|uniref:putative sugar O-methyltransferase n=1 Tax=Spongiactinospora sp. 9N601 TaxID=3375149 RepID=UPI00378FAED9
MQGLRPQRPSPRGSKLSISNSQSQLWEHINKTSITEESIADLGTFKSGGVNFKLALWDTETNGVRYLKTVAYNLAAGLGESNWRRLRRIGNRDVGDPITVTWDGERVCVDYLRAVHELEFIAERLRLDGARVLEIGAGYGRTCHAMLSNHDLAAYVVVDLPTSLELARRYLGAVLAREQFARVEFVAVEEVESSLTGAFDVCLNIDSFAEMTEDAVHYYLSLVDERCEHFYVNNPVGKYLDKSLDGHAQGQHVISLALSTGLLREIIDIHDNRQVREQSRKFVAVYRPGERWAAVADGWAPPWSYYWQALYRRHPA